MKIIIKDLKHFTFSHLLKFYGVQIKLNLKGIVLTKKIYVSGILSIINHNTESTGLREITRTKQSLQE